jgi:uncharacterized membrane protein YeaQ/YmgE (transglycosylase-associated protein family)
MKKSSFVTMILGTIGSVLFAIGMCMCLLPAWGVFQPGLIMGSIGAVILLATMLIWRKMTGKAPIRVRAKTVGITLFGIIGALTLGAGMCLAMIWSSMVLGVFIGLGGIVMLLTLIPMRKGFKNTNMEAQA